MLPTCPEKSIQQLKSHHNKIQKDCPEVFQWQYLVPNPHYWLCFGLLRLVSGVGEEDYRRIEKKEKKKENILTGSHS